MRKVVLTMALILVLSSPVFADDIDNSYNKCKNYFKVGFDGIGLCMQSYQQAITNRKLDKLIQVLSNKQDLKAIINSDKTSKDKSIHINYQ